MHSIKNKNIPIAGPLISDKEIAYVTDAVTNSWYGNENEYVGRFEKSFAEYVGRQFAITLPSCTSALHLSLLALGVGPGDEVIVPDATWIASAAPITYVGAKPVFADIDPKTWCLSKETIEKKITPNTKAIIVVNLYGNMADWDPIIDLASKYKIPLIEDGAESIGSMYKGKPSGSFGVTSCFSFHGSKTMTTGEGGMLVTDDEAIYESCLILRDHGRRPGDIFFRNFQVGYKYKMSALQAALGLAQLERIDEFVTKKRTIYSWYKKAFATTEGISLNPDHEHVYNSYWMTTLLFAPHLNINKKELILKLRENNIHTRPFFDPLTSLEAYDVTEIDTDISYDISRRGINLPSALSLTESDVNEVKKHVMNAINL